MKNHAAKAYSYGVRLRGACISGPIDLREGRNPDQGPLPPLLLKGCRLEGNVHRKDKAVLSARHAFLSRLSLTDCQAGRIDLSNAVIDGDLALDGVVPLSDRRNCQLTARSAKIKGRINASRATFQVHPGKRIPGFDIADYAFDLTDACIDNSVYLYPEFTAIGGVSFLGTKVDGDIWCHGTHLEVKKGAAFRGQSLICRGAVSFYMRKNSVPDIQGDIDLLGAELDHLTINHVTFSACSKLSAENASVNGDVQIASPSLSTIHLHGARIGGTATLSDDYSAPQPATRFRANCISRSRSVVADKEVLTTQDLEAAGISIGGDLVLENFRGNVNIENSEIGGKFQASHVNLKTLCADGAVVKGYSKIIKSGYWEPPYNIHAHNLDIGEDLIVDLPNGELTLDGSRIRNNLKIKISKHPRAGECPAAIHANNLTIDNNCELHIAVGTVQLDSSTVGGHLCILGSALESIVARAIVVRGPTELCASFSPKRRSDKLNFDGSHFGGEFCIEKLEFEPAPGMDCLLSLNDAHIERDFHVRSVTTAIRMQKNWPWGDPIAIVEGPLSFYPDWQMCEAKYDLGKHGTGYVSFLRHLHSGRLVLLLSENARAIKKLNRKFALRLRNNADIANYLRFYCSHLWEDTEAFRILEPPLSRNVRRGSHIKRLVVTAISVSQVNFFSWKCKAEVLYKTTLHDGEFTVTRWGGVTMHALEPKSGLAHPLEMRVAPPLRVTIANKASGRSAPHDLIRELTGISHPVADLAGLSRRLHPLVREAHSNAPTRVGIISLIGLKASAVSFLDQAWDKNIQVQLESFHYERLEIEGAPENRIATAPWRRWLKWWRWWRLREVRQSAAERNIRWLNLQFPRHDPDNLRKQPRFSPQPHEHLARLLRNQGKTDEAVAVTLDRMKLERLLRLGFARRAVSRLMYCFFRHGLKPEFGFTWCLIGILLGGLFFDYANYGELRWYPVKEHVAWLKLDKPVLVLDSAAVSPLLRIEKDDEEPLEPQASPSMVLATPRTAPPQDDYRCRDQVDPVLYPIELFVPLLDLKQQEKCTITTKKHGFGFRIFKLLYTIAGSIFTSLTLLSISGVLRRRVEQ